MKKKTLLPLLLCTGLVMGLFPNTIQHIQAEETQRIGRDYYISSLHGNNQNEGNTEETPWETLDKLKDVTLQPGDRILLEANSVFQGYIHLKDVRGTADAPIQITQYGEGNRPIINCDGQGVWYQDYVKPMDNSGHRSKGYVSSAILLYDTDYVEVSNLELTNMFDDFDDLDNVTADRMDRTGVAAIAQNGGVMEHTYLSDLYIHDVDGNLQDKHMDNGGIQMNVCQPVNEAETGIARYDDVQIFNNYVKDVHRAGIVLGYTYQHNQFNGGTIEDDTVQTYGHTNVVIKNNYVQDAGNDAICAMYAYRPLIENNVSDGAGVDLDGQYDGYWQSFCAAIWPWKTKDAVFQYNEAFDTTGNANGDGQAWDIDYSDGTVYQYNYSHNNIGGSMLICLSEAVNGVFRYNISQNDLKAFITFQGNPLAKIYNNVFYVDGDLSTRVHHPDNGKRSGQGWLANNIFYNMSSYESTSASAPDKYHEDWNPNNNKTFTNNIYYGYGENIPNDANAITEDPQFINAGSAPTSPLQTDPKDGTITHKLQAFDGYKVADSSPAVNAGIHIAKNTKLDFFGNKIGMLPDIGIFETNVKEAVVKTIYSDVYQINDKNIENVERNQTVSSFINQFLYSDGVTLQVKRKDGTLVNNEDIIKDNMLLEATFPDGDILTYTIHIKKSYSEYAPSGMVAEVGSYQAGEGAMNVLDNNLSTLWHTKWGGCLRSETWVSLDMGRTQPVSMLKYVPRTSQRNGLITAYEVYTKNNVADDWTLIQTGNWADDNSVKYAYFDTTEARYIKLVALDSTTQETGNIYASAAEIRLGHVDGEE